MLKTLSLMILSLIAPCYAQVINFPKLDLNHPVAPFIMTSAYAKAQGAS
ncbi:MAG: hypothetical protein R2865_10800 [Deinococcales bacterium]